MNSSLLEIMAYATQVGTSTPIIPTAATPQRGSREYIKNPQLFVDDVVSGKIEENVAHILTPFKSNGERQGPYKVRSPSEADRVSRQVWHYLNRIISDRRVSYAEEMFPAKSLFYSPDTEPLSNEDSIRLNGRVVKDSSIELAILDALRNSK
jgi:hypothetical protein